MPALSITAASMTRRMAKKIALLRSRDESVRRVHGRLSGSYDARAGRRHVVGGGDHGSGRAAAPVYRAARPHRWDLEEDAHADTPQAETQWADRPRRWRLPADRVGLEPRGCRRRAGRLGRGEHRRPA